jgi:hypothetical protein
MGKPSKIDPALEQFATESQWVKLKAYSEHGTERAAARALGLNPRAIHSARHAVLAKATRQGYSPDHDMIHPLPDGYRLKGTSTLYDMQTGEAKIQWVKSDADRDRQFEIAREVVEEMAAALPKLPPRKISASFNHNLMNVVPWGDPHFGLYCWKDEVGDDFDIDIAKRDLCSAVDYLISQAPRAKRCLLVNLGDFFHADNLEGVTSRSGNRLDMDTRLPKVIRVGVSAVRQAIESALARHETVEIINAIGNHDDVLSMALSVMLSNIYEEEPRVIVHDAPTRRHYVRHGKVLIGVTHGDQTKDASLPGIMATERPEDWGVARHRYWYRGHHHHDSVLEFPGCKVEQFRTLAAGDAYAVGHGYLSGRDMKLITHHAEFGEVGRATCSIDLLRSVQSPTDQEAA